MSFDSRVRWPFTAHKSSFIRVVGRTFRCRLRPVIGYRPLASERPCIG